MKTLALTEPDLTLGVRGERLHVTRADATIHEVPVAEVEEVLVYGDGQLTPAARRLLLRRAVDIAFLTRDGRWLGRLHGGVGAWAARRADQVRMVDSPDARLAVARAVVRAKIAGQRRHLVARQRHLKQDRLASAATALRGLDRRLDEADTVEALLGHEGLASRRYFGVFDLLLRAPGLTWNGRNRRPPTDPTNAALSWTYTLLVTRVEAAVRRAGLDPGLGTLHGVSRGAPALALDLAEPWRPWVDRLVLTTLNRRALVPTDFETPPRRGDRPDPGPDAVYLARTGRGILLRAWEQARRDRCAALPDDHRTALDPALDETCHRLRRFAQGEAPTFAPVLPVL